MKILKIAFLLDKSNNWLKKDAENFIKKYKKTKYLFKIFYDYKKIINFDIVILLGFTKIINSRLLNNNKLNITVHESSLPKDRGFSPIQYQILNNKNIIDVCLIELKNKVDSGDILETSKIYFKGNELYEEIRYLQSKKTFQIITQFLKKYPYFKRKKQTGKSNFLKKRFPKDSELNINKTIKENFNLIRINNNKEWPSFFKYKNSTYFVKVYKKKT